VRLLPGKEEAAEGSGLFQEIPCRQEHDGETSDSGPAGAAAPFAPAAWGQAGAQTPRIGYVYPAGGQQGSTIEVTVGGQLLRGVTDAYVCGEGVYASVSSYYPPGRSLTRERRQELRRRLEELRDNGVTELGGHGPAPLLPGLGPWGQGRTRPPSPRSPGRSGRPPPPGQESGRLPPRHGAPARPREELRFAGPC
jgi:hypothetical protein